MNAKKKQMVRTVVFAVTFTVMALDVFGLGSDYPDHKPVSGSNQWPSGMSGLVDTTNRVHGFFVNAEDLFFFSGTATNFTVFLEDYSRIQGIEKHCLILHDGTGDAKSPWSTNALPCDWKLYGCPKSWHNLATLQGTNSVEVLKKAASESGYVLEVHFWTGGHIALNQVSIPKNIEVRKETSR